MSWYATRFVTSVVDGMVDFFVANRTLGTVKHHAETHGHPTFCCRQGLRHTHLQIQPKP